MSEKVGSQEGSRAGNLFRRPVETVSHWYPPRVAGLQAVGRCLEEGVCWYAAGRRDINHPDESLPSMNATQKCREFYDL